MLPFRHLRSSHSRLPLPHRRAPSVASASVHAAEVLTSGASGLAHWRLGNVDPALRRLALGGVLGGVIGVFVVTAAPASIIRPFVSAYLFVVGSLIVWRAVRSPAEMGVAACLEGRPRYVSSLACVGGFLDAIGGGGGGAMVSAGYQRIASSELATTRSSSPSSSGRLDTMLVKGRRHPPKLDPQARRSKEAVFGRTGRRRSFLPEGGWRRASRLITYTLVVVPRAWRCAWASSGSSLRCSCC
jgi:hypothetical protein